MRPRELWLIACESAVRAKYRSAQESTTCCDVNVNLVVCPLYLVLIIGSAIPSNAFTQTGVSCLRESTPFSFHSSQLFAPLPHNADRRRIVCQGLYCRWCVRCHLQDGRSAHRESQTASSGAARVQTDRGKQTIQRSDQMTRFRLTKHCLIPILSPIRYHRCIRPHSKRTRTHLLLEGQFGQCHQILPDTGLELRIQGQVQAGLFGRRGQEYYVLEVFRW